MNVPQRRMRVGEGHVNRPNPDWLSSLCPGDASSFPNKEFVLPIRHTVQ